MSPIIRIRNKNMFKNSEFLFYQGWSLNIKILAFGVNDFYINIETSPPLALIRLNRNYALLWIQGHRKALDLNRLRSM